MPINPMERIAGILFSGATVRLGGIGVALWLAYSAASYVVATLHTAQAAMAALPH